MVLKAVDVPNPQLPDTTEMWLNTTHIDAIMAAQVEGLSGATQVYTGSISPLVLGDPAEVAAYLNGDRSSKPSWTYDQPEPSQPGPDEPVPGPDPDPNPAPTPLPDNPNQPPPLNPDQPDPGPLGPVTLAPPAPPVA